MLKQIFAICLVMFCLATASAQVDKPTSDGLVDQLKNPEAHGQDFLEKANKLVTEVQPSKKTADGENVESITADATTVKNNLRDIALAILNFESANQAFPTRYNKASDGRPLLSWRVHILPFINELKLYEKFKLDEPWNSPHNKKLIKEMPKVYGERSLGNGKSGQTTLVAIDHVASALMPPSRPKSTTGRNLSRFINGTSNTVLVIDDEDGESVTWTQPVDLNVDVENPLEDAWGQDGKITSAFCDSSVHTLTKEGFQKNEHWTLFTATKSEPTTAPAFGDNVEASFARPPTPAVPGAISQNQTYNSQVVGQREATRRRDAQVAPSPTLRTPRNSPPATPPRRTYATMQWSPNLPPGGAQNIGKPYDVSFHERTQTLQREAIAAADEEVREEKLTELKDQLQESFDQSIETQASELEKLEARVAKLKTAFEKRKTNRDRIIQNYVDRIRLQAEGLTIPGADVLRLTPTQTRPQTWYRPESGFSR